MKTLNSPETFEGSKTGEFYTRLFGTNSDLDMADFIRVPSIEGCVETIEKLGGRVIIPKKAVPGAGYFAVFLDAENRAFGLWQDQKAASA